jgi:flavorubredoxin
MKIAILYHSVSGNTRTFANLISDKLKAKGHSVDLIEVQTNTPVKPAPISQTPPFEITNMPDPANYDAILAGGPVWAFSISSIIYQAVNQLKNLQGISFLAFSTMGFPLTGMGGKGALKTLNNLAARQGARIINGAVVPRMFHDFNKLMEQEAEKIAQKL